MARRALVTGIGGQDESYLAKLLLGRGYQVFGTTLASTASQDGIELITWGARLAPARSLRRIAVPRHCRLVGAGRRPDPNPRAARLGARGALGQLVQMLVDADVREQRIQIARAR
jgi:hypothetical protein